jgi:large subunit ribosomal protein L25
MAIIKLAATQRQEIGSRASQSMRVSGFIPAILYAHGKPAIPLKLDSLSWSKALETELHLVMLDVSGEKPQTATVREVQRDPMSQDIIHIDLLKIEMDEAVHFSVKVNFTGTPIGTKEGGVTQVLTSHIEVECLPTNVPDFISVDITHLDLGSSLHARDLTIPENVKLITEPDVTLVSVAAVRIAVEKEEVKPVEGEVVEGEEEKKEETKE